MKAAHEFVGELAEHISMPEVYDEIRKLLLNPDTTIEDFVETVEKDSMLSVRVMRMARSPYFGIPRNCENLYQAISLIGLMQLHDLILGCLCMRTFSSVPEQVLNLKAFWRYCVQCGIASRSISRYCKTTDHPVFFTLGLLHEIGHAVMFLKAPEACMQAIDSSRLHGREPADVEKELLGFDYRQVGSEMMRLWHLPPIYQQAAAFHLQPELADEEFRLAVEIVDLAHGLCQDPGSKSRFGLVEHAIQTVPELSRLPANIEDLIAEETETHTDSILGLLWPCGKQHLEWQSERYAHA